MLKDDYKKSTKLILKAAQTVKQLEEVTEFRKVGLLEEIMREK